MPKITVYSKRDIIPWAKLLQRIGESHRTNPYDLISVEALPDSDAYRLFQDFWVRNKVCCIPNIPDVAEAEREVIETIRRSPRAINAAHVLGGLPSSWRGQEGSLIVTLAEEYGFETESIRL